MQFGPCPIQEAAGAILAHSLRAGVRTFRKGLLLTADDAAALRAAGIREVTVARLEDGDVREDEAAARIAKAASGSGVHIGAAFTGRANLYAETAGIAVVDKSRINALNAIDESITLATLTPFSRVDAGQMLATVKIIPYSVPEKIAGRAEQTLAGGAISVAAFKPHRVGLILTVLSGTKTSLLEKARNAIVARLEPMGSMLAFDRNAAHEPEAIARAFREALDAGCNPVLVLGASAISDRRDAIPAAIVQAGGRVEHFGMPVDPGNLLLIGKLDGATVVGLPGCARSPKPNGFDFVLWRLLADLPIGSQEITAMGVGGLLTEIASRPHPREVLEEKTMRAPKIAAVILAAGRSTRMGRHKLLAAVDGKPLVRHAIEAALASSAQPVIVVTGNGAAAVEKALAGFPLTIVENNDFAKGLSESLKRGINAVPADCDGAIVLLGDMPDVSSALIDKLIAAFDPAEDRTICVATRHGRRGNPVLWARRFFPEIMTLHGDVGAKSLMGLYNEFVCDVEADDDSPLTDIDTPADLAARSER